MIPDGAGGWRELTVQTMAELAAEWLDRICYCGTLKRERHMFCPGCYSKLPGKLQADVFRLVGRPGLPAAVARAKELLASVSAGRETPIASGQTTEGENHE